MTTTVTDDQISAHDGRGAPPPPVSGRPDERPALAGGVRLVGRQDASGFSADQFLVERDGRFLQISELLFRVMERIDGHRSMAEIASELSEATPWTVTPDHVRALIEQKLAPPGLATTGGDPPPRPPSPADSSPLRLQLRGKLLGADGVEPVARTLQVLFRPAVLTIGLAAILAAHVLMYAGGGLGDALRRALLDPLYFIAVFGVLVLGGVCHELGHAAALRYGGGRARAIGFGLYLIYPALYTDTSDAYRLGRRERVRTDLGGFYFHLLFAAALICIAAATGATFLLVAVLVINLDVLRQLLLPFVRLDGYWLLSDLTGLPDLFTQAKVELRRLGRRRARRPTGPALRPWPRRILLAYTAITIPVLVGLIVLFATRAPEFIAVAFGSIELHAGALTAQVEAGRPLEAAASLLRIAILSAPLIGGLLLGAIVIRLSGRAFERHSAPTVRAEPAA